MLNVWLTRPTFTPHNYSNCSKNRPDIEKSGNQKINQKMFFSSWPTNNFFDQPPFGWLHCFTPWSGFSHHAFVKWREPRKVRETYYRENVTRERFWQRFFHMDLSNVWESVGYKREGWNHARKWSINSYGSFLVAESYLPSTKFNSSSGFGYTKTCPGASFLGTVSVYKVGTSKSTIRSEFYSCV